MCCDSPILCLSVYQGIYAFKFCINISGFPSHGVRQPLLRTRVQRELKRRERTKAMKRDRRKDGERGEEEEEGGPFFVHFSDSRFLFSPTEFAIFWSLSASSSGLYRHRLYPEESVGTNLRCPFVRKCARVLKVS